MKCFISCLLFLLLRGIAFSTPVYDSLLNKLNVTLDKKSEYDAAKIKRIDNLKKILSDDDGADLNIRYAVYQSLYNEYKSFNYQEAFNCVQKLQQIGHLLKDPAKVAAAKVKLGFILLSSGMFKETFDSLRTVNIKLLADTERREYYFLTARTYYDLADFDKEDYYTPIYNSRATAYIDSGINLCRSNSFEYIYYNGLKYIKQGKIKQAIVNLRLLIEHYHLTDHEYAVTASTLSDIYIRESRPDSAIMLLAPAAMADIRASTKEAAAMLNLAQLLNSQGDARNAYVYIRQSMDDATYYGARQRKLQVGAILPVIEGERLNSVEGQRRILFLYAAALTVLVLTVVIFAVIIYKQLQKLRKADKVILEANHNLQETVDKLNESDKIKDEYIGYYFNLISEYISKLEKFKRSVDNKLTTKRFEDIKVVVNNINLSKEREELFVNFDKAFLKIFPNFVSEFNKLFDDEHQVKLMPDQLLNSDLRIFALIRLGIHDTEKIANILEYSVNTIYNYKARIKSKSKVPNEGFETAIMAIKAI